MGENKTNSIQSVIELDSDVAELERLRVFIDTFCGAAFLSEETCYQLQIALEELVINVMNYGQCNPQKGAIRLSMRRQADEIVGVLSDRGISFNPLDAPAPDLTADVRDRQIGGLGIHLVRNLLQSLRYERSEGWNYLYFTKQVNPTPGVSEPEGERHANRNGNNQS